MMETEPELEHAFRALEGWVTARDFCGHDPHDALNSPILRRLTLGNRWLAVAWVQLLRRSPVNLRRWLGIREGYNPKAMGLFLAGYARRYAATGAAADRERISQLVNWLRANRQAGYHGACWGYNFDWPNRAFYAPAGTPTIVNTAFIAHAFLDLHERFGDPGGLEVARSACFFVLEDLARTVDSSGHCFSYTPLDRRCVHNANLLGASLLARVAVYTQEEELRVAARQAASFSLARQQPNGAWPYGEGWTEGWSDNFHTAYVLVALADLYRDTGDERIPAALQKGYEFWKKNFFLPDGAPKFYSDRVCPLDIHCAAQGILTFFRSAALDPEARACAFRLARWTIAHMQNPRGYFDYQLHRLYRIRIPYIRWAQAWMFRALAECCWCEAASVEAARDVQSQSLAGGKEDRTHAPH